MNQLILSDIDRGIGDNLCAYRVIYAYADSGILINFYTGYKEWIPFFHENINLFNLTDVPSNNIEISVDVNTSHDQYYNMNYNNETYSKWYSHIIQRNAYKSFDLKLDLVSPQKTFNNIIDGYHEKISKSESYIVIAPHSSELYKNWSPYHFRRLIKLISTHIKIPIYVLSTYQELQKTNSITNEIENCYKFVNKSPAEISRLIKNCSLYIGNDSGISHLANMLGVKMISLSATNDPMRLYDNTDNVVSMLQPKLHSCFGCHKDESKGFDFNCNNVCSTLQSISPIEVFEKVQSILNPTHISTRESLVATA